MMTMIKVIIIPAMSTYRYPYRNIQHIQLRCQVHEYSIPVFCSLDFIDIILGQELAAYFHYSIHVFYIQDPWGPLY